MRVDPILRNKFTNILEFEKLILKKHPDDLNDRKVRGNIFEDLTYLYFFTFKELYNLKEIYRNRSNEIPNRYKKLFNIYDDFGVDGLGITNNNEGLAWQSKFIKDRSPPSYQDITKLYHQGKNCNYNYIVANSVKLSDSKIYYSNTKHKQILYDKFLELNSDDWLEINKIANNISFKKKYYIPNKFQNEIVEKVTKGLQNNNRGKLIAACGTGKTLLSIWINEKLKNNKKILFVVPSLLLMRQTLKKWVQQSKKRYSYLCICSDSQIIKKLKQEEDEFDIDSTQIDIPLTDSKEIKKWLLNNRTDVVIFSTYQSLPSIKSALANTNIEFDLIVFDEAHRTAGAKYEENFSLALNNKNIKSRKRLFMTATERFVTKRTKKIADRRGYPVFSMDDVSLYGPTLADLSFGKAIKEDLISDYKILTAEITEDQIYEHIKKNELLDLEEFKKNNENYLALAKKIAHQIVLFQAVENFKIRKIITFHSKIDRAKNFIYSNKKTDNLSLGDIFNFFSIKNDIVNYSFKHLNAKDYSAEERTTILNETFNFNELGVISNAKCLTEGIDVPIIDSIFFSDPKKSLIDIVQACGRALRLPFNHKGGKMAYFIVPIIIPKNLNQKESIDEENFETLYELVQALRDLDFRMEDWIDAINLKATTGGGGGPGPIDPGPIVVLPNNKVDVHKFKEKLILKIAEAKSRPSTIFREPINFGKGERKAPTVKWGPIGDMSTQALKNLTLKTINIFPQKKDVLSKHLLNWQHNAISHTLRTGFINKCKEKDKFQITKIGKKVKKNNNIFTEVLKNKIFHYSIDIGGDKVFCPYKAIIRIILENKYLEYHEFAFCLYTLVGDTNELVLQANERIKYFRNLNYNFKKNLSEKNKDIILNKLNTVFGTDFRKQDIWATTTVKNKFIYFRRHLVDCEILEIENQSIKINEKNRKETIKAISID